MEKWTYALLLLASVAIPLFRSFEPRIQFYRKWPALFTGIFMMMLLFIPWDVIFTQRGIWAFNHQYVSGLFILGLPLEEWLFFVVITYCVVFTYEVLRFFLPRLSYPRIAFWLSILIGAGLVVIALSNTDKTYTWVVMLVTGLLIWLQALIGAHRSWLSHFYLTYLITLIPFIIVNGILTSFPVVIYNNAENLGIRVLTIPIEDFAYLLGMMALTLLVYHKIERANRIQKTIPQP